MDLSAIAKVNENEAKEFARKNNAIFHLTSADNGNEK